MVVTVQGCGGPYPGHCSPQRHVSVRAIETRGAHKGAVTTGSTNRYGKVEFSMCPGRWRVVANNGFRKRSKSVVGCSHATTRVHFRLDNGIP